ncbi:hypothetical protein ACFLWO_02430 [Chloroflexota bacterium]
METHSDWYNKIVREINSYKDTLSKKDYKKYKLDLLLRIAKRVDDFSSYCGECQMFQPEITRLAEDLGNLIQIPNKEERKGYLKTINNMVKHLQKQHKLVSEGQYVGIGLAIGAGIGTALGAALDNTGVGTAMGTGIALAIGRYLDNKAKNEGKVI